MDFSEKIAELSKKVKNLGDGLKSEEATKNALVMPFIAALGYDVFNPSEVVPGPIRGFAVTLSLGIVASMFTAIFVSRAVFEFWIQRNGGKRISV